MRLKDPARTAISSLPPAGSSGTSICPTLIWSAIVESLRRGRTTAKSNRRSNKIEAGQKHRRQRDHQRLKRLIRHPNRQRHGHRDNLRAHNLVELPAESVVRSVAPNHRGRRRVRLAVALQAGRFGLYGPRQEKRRPGRRVPLSHPFARSAWVASETR